MPCSLAELPNAVDFTFHLALMSCMGVSTLLFAAALENIEVSSQFPTCACLSCL